MKFDIKKKHLTKSRLVRKLLIGYVVTLLLLALFSMTFVAKSASPETPSGLDNKPSDPVIDPSGLDNKPSDPVIDPPGLSDAAPNEQLVPIEEIESITENELGNLSSEEEKEVTTENSMDIDGIKFTPATNLKDVKVTVVKLKNKPEEITEPPKKNISVYKYLDIKLTADDEYVEEEDIKSLEVKFKVEQTWITDNNIDKETIILMRYHDGEWQSLSTAFLSEDDTYVYYEAETPGCSTFAVVGSKVVEKHESYVTEGPSIPWTIIIPVIISLTIILVVVLFKARYIYLEEDLKEAEKAIK